MRVIGAVMAVVFVAGCGADGEPLRPAVKTTLSVGSDGVSTSTGVSVTKGPVSLGVSF